MSQPVDPDAAILVVGASLAGLRAAEELRHEGHRGPVVIVGEEPHAPYDRPPLSKQLLSGKWTVDRIHHHAPDSLDTLGLDFRLGLRATGLDTDARTVTLDDGSALSYDGLVIATGAAARRLPATDGVDGVFALRTLDDCLALKARVEGVGEGVRLVVVGAGFIGSEVAATLRGLGATVTVVEAMPAPLAHVLGPEMGAACTALHADNGVEVRAGVGVDGIEEAGRGGVMVVRLTDGGALEADVVVAGIGVDPCTGWLDGSGLTVANGVVCDGRLFAGERVVAAGDVARWTHPQLEADVRIEHWTNAAESGAAAARNLLAGSAAAEPYAPVAFFWSDQYATKIQLLGRPAADDEVVVVDGSVDERRFVALYRRGGRLTGALAFSRPRQLMAYRPLLATGASFDEAMEVSKA